MSDEEQEDQKVTVSKNAFLCLDFIPMLTNYSNLKLPYGFPLAIWSTRQLWHTTRMRLLSSLEL